MDGFITRLYFVRHGESEANRLHNISNRGRKHEATAKGRDQVAALAARIVSSKITQLFSSPLLRAVQTATILAQTWKADLTITDALRKYDCGILEGKSDAASWERYRQLRADWIDHHRWGSRIDQGESFLDMQQQFAPFIKTLLRQSNHPDEAILFIGHGGIYACLLPLILKNVSFSMAPTYPFPNTAYVLAELQNGELLGRDWCGIPLTERAKVSPMQIESVH